MSIKTEKTENYTLLTVQSEKLNSSIAPTLKAELVMLDGEGIKNIVVDLSATRYCDSSGLSAVLVGNRICKNNEGVFALVGLQPGVRKVIEISKLDTVLNIKGNLSEAIEMFQN